MDNAQIHSGKDTKDKLLYNNNTLLLHLPDNTVLVVLSIKYIGHSFYKLFYLKQTSKQTNSSNNNDNDNYNNNKLPNKHTHKQTNKNTHTHTNKLTKTTEKKLLN